MLDPGDDKLVENWPADESPEQAYKNVMNFWGNPLVNGPTRAVLMDFAKKSGQQADVVSLVEHVGADDQVEDGGDDDQHEDDGHADWSVHGDRLGMPSPIAG